MNRITRKEIEERVARIAKALDQAYMIDYNSVYGGWAMQERVPSDTDVRGYTNGRDIVGGFFGHRMSNKEFDAFLDGMEVVISRFVH